MADRLDAQPAASGRLPGRGDYRGLETELLRFPEPRVAMRDRADLAGEPDFAEPHAPRRRGRALQRGNERGGHGEVRRRLGNAQPARDIEIDVAPAERDPGPRLQHGQHHGEPSGVPADDGPARRAGGGRADQRLDFDQQRPRALHARKDRRAGERGTVLPVPEEKRGGVGDLARPRSVISNTPISSVAP